MRHKILLLRMRITHRRMLAIERCIYRRLLTGYDLLVIMLVVIRDR